MTLLAVDDLAVRYGGAVLALDGVSFEVPEKGSVALLGANGAGKTTVLRAVSGLLRFNRGAIVRGSVRLDGRSVDGRDSSRLVAAGVVQVLEGRRIFRDLSVAENLRAGSMGAGGRGGEARNRDRVLELFPILRERLEQPGGLLSGGEQSMLAIGRALMASPRLLLLDEPSLGLAPLVVRQIGEVLTRINDEGVAILLVDQSTALALQATRHAHLLETGRVVHHAPTPELLADPQVRASYLGTKAGDRELGAMIEDAAS
jgi:branched-chain amino acid transport system ATP-binding protein